MMAQNCVEKIMETNKSWTFQLEFVKIIQYNFLVVESNVPNEKVKRTHRENEVG